MCALRGINWLFNLNQLLVNTPYWSFTETRETRNSGCILTFIHSVHFQEKIQTSQKWSTAQQHYIAGQCWDEAQGTGHQNSHPYIRFFNWFVLLLLTPIAICYRTTKGAEYNRYHPQLKLNLTSAKPRKLQPKAYSPAMPPALHPKSSCRRPCVCRNHKANMKTELPKESTDEHCHPPAGFAVPCTYQDAITALPGQAPPPYSECWNARLTDFLLPSSVLSWEVQLSCVWNKKSPSAQSMNTWSRNSFSTSQEQIQHLHSVKMRRHFPTPPWNTRLGEHIATRNVGGGGNLDHF